MIARYAEMTNEGAGLIDSVRLNAMAAKAYERRFECRTQSAENYDGWAYNAKCRELWSMKVKENSEKRGYLCKTFLLVRAAYSVTEITSRWGQLLDPHKNITFIYWCWGLSKDPYIAVNASDWTICCMCSFRNRKIRKVASLEHADNKISLKMRDPRGHIGFQVANCWKGECTQVSHLLFVLLIMLFTRYMEYTCKMCAALPEVGSFLIEKIQNCKNRW